MSTEIIENEMITAKLNSAVASELYSSGHITVHKRQNFILPKFFSATSAIRNTLYEMAVLNGWTVKV